MAAFTCFEPELGVDDIVAHLPAGSVVCSGGAYTFGKNVTLDVRNVITNTLIEMVPIDHSTSGDCTCAEEAATLLSETTCSPLPSDNAVALPTIHARKKSPAPTAPPLPQPSQTRAEYHGLGVVENVFSVPESAERLNVPHRYQLGDVGCGLYSLGMVMDYWHAADKRNPTALCKPMDRVVASKNADHVVFQPTVPTLLLDVYQELGFTRYGETYACEYLATLAQKFGYRSVVHHQATWQTLKACIDRGHPPIVCVDLDLKTFHPGQLQVTAVENLVSQCARGNTLIS